MDSGACDSVINPEDLPEYVDTVVETEASRNGEEIVSASGDPIPNDGEFSIPMITREKTIRAFKFQAAGVNKGLVSVDKMNEAVHVVVFDWDNSYIYHKQTQEINMMRREEGNFMLDVWVPPPSAAKDMGFGRHPSPPSKADQVV